MARGSGTGSPIWFRCAAARRDPRSRWQEHRVTLTGRARPYRARRGRPARSAYASYEYRCACGHVGWSNHIDLARWAGMSREWSPHATVVLQNVTGLPSGS